MFCYFGERDKTLRGEVTRSGLHGQGGEAHLRGNALHRPGHPATSRTEDRAPRNLAHSRPHQGHWHLIQCTYMAPLQTLILWV